MQVIAKILSQSKIIIMNWVVAHLVERLLLNPEVHQRYHSMYHLFDSTIWFNYFKPLDGSTILYH